MDATCSPPVETRKRRATAGINTKGIVTAAYVISGALTAISGIIIAFYTNSVSPANHGNAYELYGIAAAVLGGCSLRGGEGSVVGNPDRHSPIAR